MKNKDNEIEMHVASPSDECTCAPENERIQTIERALCGVLDRLDAIEKKLFLISEFYEKKSEHKHDIWESLEHEGLAERCEGTLVLTMKGRQVASLLDNGEIEDIRSD